MIPAAYVLLVRSAGEREPSEVLLALRRGTGYMDEHWAFGAAGHVEVGESVLAAAVREVDEELGVQIREADLEPLTVMHRTARNGEPIDERVDFFFAVRAWRGEPVRREPHKSADLRWFDVGALPEPVVPHELVVLDRIRTGRVPAVTVVGF